MKKQMIFAFVLVSLIISMSSCKLLEKLAYVTIFNEGDFPILASVDGSEENINPRDYTTWEISLEANSMALVDLYCELIEDPSYYDSETISIEEGEVFLWVQGWVEEAARIVKVIKKRSTDS